MKIFFGTSQNALQEMEKRKRIISILHRLPWYKRFLFYIQDGFSCYQYSSYLYPALIAARFSAAFTQSPAILFTIKNAEKYLTREYQKEAIFPLEVLPLEMISSQDITKEEMSQETVHLSIQKEIERSY